MALIQISAPSAEPVTLADVKTHLRIPTTSQGGSTDEDVLISAYIKVARKQCENIIKRQLVNATWQLVLPAFPGGSGDIWIKRPPMSTVSTDLVITYRDTSNSTQTLASTFYEVQYGEHSRIFPAYENYWSDLDTIVHPSAVSVQYVSGYTSSTAIPEEIALWIKMQVGSLYEFREPVSDIAFNFKELPRNSFDGLLDAYRVEDFRD